ncbi:MAG: tRNA glutamyl-Q(34) synthetase GluQRS [Gammaproteobacteria bacterium]|nr:tRNA glutamyl-Q(34) synthetase GluQRS [Gammaproteobacteria bacterium]
MPHTQARHADATFAQGCGRYAPSPTGPLHLGNARTALLAWLQARLNGSRFVLRMEDLDRPRVRPGSAAQILDDLRWLGLEWDEGPDVQGARGPYLQSARHELYAQAVRELESRGLIFPCYCSRKDIAMAASAPQGSGDRSIYPGTCRSNSTRTRPQGREAALRYRVPSRRVVVSDMIVGRVEHHLPQEVGDFVVRRADQLHSYQLAVVVDDALMGVTDVVRGADLLDSAPRQAELFERLGFTVPRFWHVPLMQDEQGERMSKRDGSASIEECRQRRESPQRVVGRLATSVGLVREETEISAQELLEQLSIEKFIETLRASAGCNTTAA